MATRPRFNIYCPDTELYLLRPRATVSDLDVTEDQELAADIKFVRIGLSPEDRQRNVDEDPEVHHIVAIRPSGEEVTLCVSPI